MAISSVLVTILIVTANTMTAVTAIPNCNATTFKLNPRVKFKVYDKPIDEPIWTTDENACTNACSNLTTCSAVSYDTVTHFCHFMPIDYMMLKDKTSQFRSYVIVQRCLRQRCITWSNYTNLHSFGAQQYSQYTDLTSCLSGCVSTNTCVAVDLNNNVNPPTCWIHTDIAKVRSTAVTATGDMQYRLDRTCASTEGPSASPGNCFQDDPNDSDLPVTANVNVLTQNTCGARCASLGFKYSGTQNGVVCKCGNAFGKHGWSRSPCSTPCAGNSSQMCGGPTANTIRKTSVRSGGFMSKPPRINGRCFHDGLNTTEWDTTVWEANNLDNSPDNCRQHCFNLGFTWSGTRAAAHCYCGNVPGYYGWGLVNVDMFLLEPVQPLCDAPCTDGQREICGGPSAFTLEATYAQDLSEYTDYNYCYKDNPLVPDLPVIAMWNDPTLTPMLCLKACHALNYPVSATQNGVHCFCGHTIGRYGWSYGEGCDVPCSGDSKYTCGGVDTNAYLNTFIVNAKRAGMCCVDNHRNPDLSFELFYDSQQMTHFKCLRGCAAKGYPYAGLQDGTTCFCGYSYCSYGMAHNCGTPCSGDDTEDCGGNLANFVLSTLPDELLINRCFKDDGEIRDLPILAMESDTMTQDACVRACTKRGFLWAGVQNGRECRCGSIFGRHGWSKDCNMNCPGAPWSNCGGALANYIMPADNIDNLPQCMHDGLNPRDLPYEATRLVHGLMTRDRCMDACEELRFPYAAVQYGYTCFCGFEYGRYGTEKRLDETRCNMPCPGDPSITCGGAGYNYVMDTNDHAWTFHSCNVDNAANPDMFEMAFDNDAHLTHSRCLDVCSDKGYKYAGMQNGNRCSCGNTFGRYGWVKRGCNIPCTGNPHQLCGGDGLNYVMVASIAGIRDLPPVLVDNTRVT